MNIEITDNKYDNFIKKANEFNLLEIYNFELIEDVGIESGGLHRDFRELKNTDEYYFLGTKLNDINEICILNKEAEILISHNSLRGTFYLKKSLLHKGKGAYVPNYDYRFSYYVRGGYIFIDILDEYKYDHYHEYSYMISHSGIYINNVHIWPIILYDKTIIQNGASLLLNRDLEKVGRIKSSLRNIPRGYIRTDNEVFDIELNVINEGDLNYFEDVKVIRKSIENSSLSNAYKYEFINRDGQSIFNMQYDFALDFYNNVSWVLNGNNWELIDKIGNIFVKIPSTKVVNENKKIKYTFKPYYQNLSEFDYGLIGCSFYPNFRTNGVLNNELLFFNETVDVYSDSKVETTQNIVLLNKNGERQLIFDIINNSLFLKNNKFRHAFEEKKHFAIKNIFDTKDNFIFICYLNKDGLLYLKPSWFFGINIKFITTKEFLTDSDISQQNIKIFEIFEASEKISTLKNITNKNVILEIINQELLSFLTS
ncbi:hypothetical protein GCM10011514_40880 [Emticicia aquatilis]|uniref:WG repeat-containing protein n=1 Tax=Emticicia aquatilis TaxID=1537369 RepID=A0A916Z291_9BACT|nr:WG repeat-containing protein [Emticicia aquatilis]GGD72597.1 hypothetical protein GCM10011514_40880 [Emticicia aquatilis]